MKHISIFMLLTTIVCSSLLCSCTKKTTPETTTKGKTSTESANYGKEEGTTAAPESYEEQEKLIESFFDCFKEKDYDGMKQFCTEECVENYFHGTDVFGFEKAELLNFQPEEFLIRDEEYWFGVHLKVLTLPKSALYPEETADLYMVLIKSDNKWMIKGLETG